MKINEMLGKGAAVLTATLAPAIALAAPASNVIVDPDRATRTFEMSPGEHWEEIIAEVFWDLTIIGVIFAVIAIWFVMGSIRKNAGDSGEGVKLSPQAALGWVMIPTFLFMADDFFLFAKGWELHNHYREVPADAYEIKVTGAMWSWTYTYPDGVEIYPGTDGADPLRLPKDVPVLFRMTSNDVIHSHYLDEFHVTEDLMPGRLTYEWALPKKVGKSVVTCREYCGQDHSRMYTTVEVMEKADFNAWIQGQGGTGIALNAQDAKSGAVAKATAVSASKI